MSIAPDTQRFPDTWGTETIEAKYLPLCNEWRVTIRTEYGATEILLDGETARDFGLVLTGGDQR